MASGQLLLVFSDGDASTAKALAEEVLSGCAPPARPEVHPLSTAQLQELDARHLTTDAVWLYAGAEVPASQLYAALDLIEHWNLPTILSRVGESHPAGTAYHDGVVIAPPDADPQHLRLILQTALCQGQLVRQLRQDLALTQRHHVGLAGQMDRIDEELRLAARIQQQFLPQTLPDLMGVSFHVLFRPAGYVSGDIYDAKRLDEEHMGFYVADAVGHGVPAALLTMFIKQALQTRAVRGRLHRVIPPHEALAQLNFDLLNRYAKSVHFVTACYAVINCRTRQLQLARAGHPAALLLRGDGRTDALSPDGPLLGVFEDAEIESMTATLDPGDRLLIYSDGFEIAFGDERQPINDIYMRELNNLRHGPPARAIRRLGDKLDQQSGSLHQRDDITALLLDIAPTPARKGGAGAGSRPLTTASPGP